LRFVRKLCAEEVYDADEGKWIFKSGGSCFQCTDSAMKIAKKFDGQVLGYFSNRNTSAQIGERLVSGHDFAFIHDRYIVDYWAYRVRKILAIPILDIENPRHRRTIRMLYGDQNKWESVPLEITGKM
jgi:hypothetical protein